MKDGLDVDHTRGYALAEFMFRNFGFRNSFVKPEEIFTYKNGKLTLSSGVIDKLSEKEKKSLEQLYKKIDTIYHLKENLDIEFRNIDSTLDTLRNTVYMFSTK